MRGEKNLQLILSEGFLYIFFVFSVLLFIGGEHSWTRQNKVKRRPTGGKLTELNYDRTQRYVRPEASKLGCDFLMDCS